MEEVDLGVCKGRWYARDPDRVVVILPGARYLPFAPLLWFAREVVMSRGWSVLEVWDEYVDRSLDPWRWVEERAEAALGRASGARTMLVTKSITSRAVTIATERSLPGVWLTPLLNNVEIAAGFASLRAPALLVGGTADESWDPAVVAGRHEVLEIESGDHALQIPGDPLASIHALRRVIDRMLGFVGAIT